MKARETTSKRTEFPRKFCLDANLSYRVAEALALVGHPVLHVSTCPPLQSAVKGQAPAPDDKVAQWCAVTEHVLVTIDEDFRGRWARSGALEREGVEVIVFTHEIEGLPEQHRRLTLHLPGWQSVLQAQPYSHRIWTQHAIGSPKLTTGTKKRPRARPQPTVEELLARKKRIEIAQARAASK